MYMYVACCNTNYKLWKLQGKTINVYSKRLSIKLQWFSRLSLNANLSNKGMIYDLVDQQPQYK